MIIFDMYIVITFLRDDHNRHVYRNVGEVQYGKIKLFPIMGMSFWTVRLNRNTNFMMVCLYHIIHQHSLSSISPQHYSSSISILLFNPKNTNLLLKFGQTELSFGNKEGLCCHHQQTYKAYVPIIQMNQTPIYLSKFRKHTNKSHI